MTPRIPLNEPQTPTGRSLNDMPRLHVADCSAPPASGGIPLIDVDLLRDAHRMAAVIDGDYMENVVKVYARLASESSPTPAKAPHDHPIG